MTTPEVLLEELRPGAFAIAYRMLGSVSEAEDVVQESLLRVHRALSDGQRIESPRAFTATVTTRLAIDELRSARARREHYVGDWLPEPILTDGNDDPARHAEMADSLSMAMLVLLESLSPEQRAVLLLRDVFDYGYEEISTIVGKSEDNVRQLAVRARRHVEAGRPRYEVSDEQRDEFARRFIAAAGEGELSALEALLADDVVLTGDGGGRVPALAHRLTGRNRVARTLRNWLRLGPRTPGASARPAAVNGGPGVLLLDGEQRVIGVWGTRSRRRRNQTNQLDHQPRQARTPGTGGRLDRPVERRAGQGEAVALVGWPRWGQSTTGDRRGSGSPSRMRRITSTRR